MVNLEEKNALRREIADDLLTYTGGAMPDHLFDLMVDYVLSLVKPDYGSHGIEWKKLPANVKSDLRDAWSGPETLDALEVKLAEEVKWKTPDELFGDWLDYNGIMNWARTVRNALDGIRAASRPRKK